MEYLLLLPAITLYAFILLLLGGKSFKYKLLASLLLLFSLIGYLFYFEIKSATASTEMTASVGLTKDNCETSYLVNKECFDNCLK